MVKSFNSRGHNLHLLKHSLETVHENVASSDSSIISKNFNRSKRKRKTAEPKQLRRTLNVHDK